MQLGCGLFGLTYELENDFWGTFQKLKKSGFTAVEPLYAFKNDPALLPDSPIPSFLKTILWNEEKVLSYLPRLQEIGLEISSMHVGFLFGISVKDSVQELLKLSQKTGIQTFITSLEFDTKEKAESAAELLNTANRLLYGTNLRLGYHNHYMEFKTEIINGKQMTLMDYFLSITDYDVKLQLDTGWQMYGGSEVLPFIEKYQDRILSVHLKDFVEDFASIEKDNAFAAIGDGVLPTKEIINQLPSLSLIEHGLMIDQDQSSKGSVLFKDLQKGADYLKRLLA